VTRMDAPLPPLPTFLIIGAQKSATRWLRLNLGRHPEIFAAERELEFFNYRKHYEELGIDWYRRQFEGWSGEPIVGEATPGYMMPRHNPGRVANRIKAVVPDVRLLAVLRNPIDRAYSAMLHHIKRGRLAPGTRLLDIVCHPTSEHEWLGVITGGQYAASLRPFVRRFGDQLLVLLHDDVRDNPRAVYLDALRHVGAARQFVPPEIDQIVFSNASRISAPRLSAEERTELYPFFAYDLQQLETLLRVDLSRWRPGATSVHARDVERLGEHYGRSVAWAVGVLSAVDPKQYEEPTPCAGWSVRDILEHLVRTTLFYAWMLERDNSEPLPAERPSGLDDVLGGDPATAYRKAAGLFAGALERPGTLERLLSTNVGPAPALAFARLAVVNQIAHVWDVAVATGQTPLIPDDVVHVAQELAYITIPGTRKPDSEWGEVLPVSPIATPTERFIAYLGRDPERWCARVREGS